MNRPGLHSTLNDGFAWKPAAAKGLEGDPNALAVHPEDAANVAVATSKGIFESTDSGETFQRRAQTQGTSVHYDLDGKHLWIGYFDGQARLARARLRGGPPTQTALPELKNDAVAYVAQNPAKRDEYALATFERSVFLTRDGGRTWTPIAERGRGK